MNAEQDTSGPAFPSHGSMGEVVQTGMTLRQYYAGKALAGLCAGMTEHRKKMIHEGSLGGAIEARVARIVADRMIEEIFK